MSDSYWLKIEPVMPEDADDAEFLKTLKAVAKSELIQNYIPKDTNVEYGTFVDRLNYLIDENVYQFIIEWLPYRKDYPFKKAE